MPEIPRPSQLVAGVRPWVMLFEAPLVALVSACRRSQRDTLLRTVRASSLPPRSLGPDPISHGLIPRALLPKRNVGFIPFGFTRASAARIAHLLIETSESLVHAAWFWRFKPVDHVNGQPAEKGPAPHGIVVWTSRRVLLIALRVTWGKYWIAAAHLVRAFPSGEPLPRLATVGRTYDSAAVHGKILWFAHDCVPSTFSWARRARADNKRVLGTWQLYTGRNDSPRCLLLPDAPEPRADQSDCPLTPGRGRAPRVTATLPERNLDFESVDPVTRASLLAWTRFVWRHIGS